MTALNFFVQPEEIILAIDTLALDADERAPLTFLTKYLILPHLKTVATGTGNGEFLADWYSYVRSQIVARDVDRLNEFCPQALQRIATEHNLDESSATVYHFGFSTGRERYVAYVYRSSASFASEEILDGLGVKPPVEIPTDPSFPQAFVDIMERQHDDDRELPIEQRVGVGGEIQCVHLHLQGYSVFNLHRFDTYEADYASVCRRLE